MKLWVFMRIFWTHFHNHGIILLYFIYSQQLTVSYAIKTFIKGLRKIICHISLIINIGDQNQIIGQEYAWVKKFLNNCIWIFRKHFRAERDHCSHRDRSRLEQSWLATSVRGATWLYPSVTLLYPATFPPLCSHFRLIMKYERMERMRNKPLWWWFVTLQLIFTCVSACFDVGNIVLFRQVFGACTVHNPQVVQVQLVAA